MNQDESVALWRRGREAWNAWAEDILRQKAELEKSGTWNGDKSSIDWSDETRKWIEAAQTDLSGLRFMTRALPDTAEKQVGQPEEGSRPADADVKTLIIEGDDIDFKGFVFPWQVHFGTAQFQGKTDFQGARFHGKAVFQKAQFHGDAGFWDARFFGTEPFQGKADFEGAQFHGETRFGYAQFYREAGFKSVQFHRDADFVNAQFHWSSDFQGAQFHGEAVFWKTGFHVAVFTDVQFHGKANFGEAQFRGEASFRSAQFHRDADFGGLTAQFHHYAWFSDVQFHGKARFLAVRFQRQAKFASANFERSASFQNALFGSKAEPQFADFTAIKADRAFDLTNAQFSKVPAFSQADFKQAPDLDNVSFPARPFWRGGDKDLVPQYRALKRLAVQGHDYEREQMAFKGELRSRRWLIDKWYGPSVWFGMAYDFFADCGRSIWRPFVTWAALVLVFAAFYFWRSAGNLPCRRFTSQSRMGSCCSAALATRGSIRHMSACMAEMRASQMSPPSLPTSRPCCRRPSAPCCSFCSCSRCATSSRLNDTYARQR
jgi:uncharacterized protein YjbI with pentapeptide repeats